MKVDLRVTPALPPLEVGLGLRKLVAFPQDWTPCQVPHRRSAAEVRPRVPNLGSPLELDERRGTVQSRRSELLAVNQEVVRQYPVAAFAPLLNF